MQKGLRDLGAKAYSLGGEYGDPYPALFENPETGNEVKQLILDADRNFRATLTRLHASSVASCQAEFPDDDLRRVAEAIWVQSHTETFTFNDPMQKPWYFFVPGLEPRAWFERGEFPGLAALEANFDAIRAEMETALDIARDSTPYIQGAVGATSEVAHLANSRQWTSLHLFSEAQPNKDVCARFPRTVAAFRDVPLVRIDGVPLEIFFSILQPGTHITPHHGLANSRLTTHLPLVIPENAALRAGKETRVWRPGECLIFDDSYEHEAWNRSDRIRIVLIFELWNPQLSTAERAAIENSFAARKAWLETRESDVMADIP